IGNYEWSDLNNNGLNDEPTTAGINGVTVELWNATTNTLLASTATANNGGNPGYYNFNICTDGDYKVKFPTTVGGNSLTTQTSTASTDNNSDANTSTGFSPTFTMTLTGIGTQVNNPTIDAGYQSCVKPNAGSNQTACGGNCVTLTGTNLTTGTWTAQTGNPAGATLGVTTTGVASVCFSNASAGTYNFIYTVGTCTDTMNVTVTAKPNAGIDATICAGNCMNITGTANTGTWTAQTGNPAGATLGATTTGVANVCFTNASVGTYSFIYTINGCTDTMNITVTAKPTAGADQMLCVQNSGSSVTLTASVAGGTWTAMAGNAGTATIVTPNNATTVVNAFSTNGDYNFIYTTASGCKDTVKVTAYTPGTIGNYVWNDLNSNGQQDEAAINGINGVTVELYMETAPGSGVYTLSQTTTTANNGSGDAGYYNFNVCQSANYKIKFPTTNGAATLTTQNSNAGFDGNSDPNTSTGFTQPFAINVLGS
ncbi:MAG: SdrD B-like domain-containing protein, partial [Dolichospermum sp.]